MMTTRLAKTAVTCFEPVIAWMVMAATVSGPAMMLVAMLSPPLEASGFFDGGSFSKPNTSFATPGAEASGTIHGPEMTALRISYSGSAFAAANVSLPEGSPRTVAIGRWPNTSSLNFEYGTRVLGPGLIFFVGSGSGSASSFGLSGTPPSNTFAAQGNGGEVRFGNNGPTMQSFGSFVNGSLVALIPVPAANRILTVSDHTYAMATAVAGGSLTNAFAIAQSQTTWTASFLAPAHRTAGSAVSTSSGPWHDYIVHGWRSNGHVPWVNSLQAALLQIPDHQVTVFDWSDEASSLIPENALNNAWSQGDVLGRQLVQDIQNGTDPAKIRLIGHSYGNAVVEVAGQYVWKTLGVKIGQAALLDMPQKDFGNDPDGERSIKGFRTNAFGYVQNIFVEGPGAFGARLNTASGNVGNFLVELGDMPYEGLSAHQQITWHFTHLLSLGDSFVHSNATGNYRETSNIGQVESTSGLVPYPAEPSLLETTPLKWQGVNATFEMTENQVTEIHLEEHSPAIASTYLLVPMNARYLQFAYSFAQDADGDTLSLHFNDRQLFYTDIMATPPGEIFQSPLLDIGDLQGVSGQLSFLLTSVGNSNAEIFIEDFQFYTEGVPEPATLTLGVLAALLLVPFVRGRFRRTLQGT